MANEYMERIRTAAETIRKATGDAEIGLILGSGLGNYAETLEDARCIKYSDIPGFPVSTVPGHAGIWWNGMLNGKRVCVMQGRFHAYEGYDMRDVTLPIRVMKLLGVRTVILTNAAGGVNVSFHPGDLMILTDVINFSGINPLIGENLDEFGPRFPDMTYSCDKKLALLCESEAAKAGVSMQKGVYMWFSGPSYETPAEIRMARILGADAIGMSTVPEIIVANHSGMKVLGISCITNLAAGMLDQPLSHQEVVDVSNMARDRFRAVLNATIRAMD